MATKKHDKECDCKIFINNSGWKMLLFCELLWLGGLIGMIILMLDGLNDINQYNIYKQKSTKEECYLLDVVDSSQCSNHGHRQYQYTAFAIDKCGNNTILYSEYDDCIQKGESKEPEKYYGCYVLDCNDEKFVFELQLIKGYGNMYFWLGIVFGALFLIPFTVFTYYGIRRCIKHI